MGGRRGCGITLVTTSDNWLSMFAVGINWNTNTNAKRERERERGQCSFDNRKLDGN